MSGVASGHPSTDSISAGHHTVPGLRPPRRNAPGPPRGAPARGARRVSAPQHWNRAARAHALQHREGARSGMEKGTPATRPFKTKLRQGGRDEDFLISTHTLRPSLDGDTPCIHESAQKWLAGNELTMEVVRARHFSHTKWATLLAPKRGFGLKRTWSNSLGINHVRGPPKPGTLPPTGQSPPAGLPTGQLRTGDWPGLVTCPCGGVGSGRYISQFHQEERGGVPSGGLVH